MLLSAVSVLVVAQSSSEIPEELVNNPVYRYVLKLQDFDSQGQDFTFRNFLCLSIGKFMGQGNRWSIIIIIIITITSSLKFTTTRYVNIQIPHNYYFIYMPVRHTSDLQLQLYCYQNWLDLGDQKRPCSSWGHKESISVILNLMDSETSFQCLHVSACIPCDMKHSFNNCKCLCSVLKGKISSVNVQI